MKIHLPLLLFCTAAALAAPPEKPNILILLSDDQGYADTGFQGSKDIPTPNLDRLAASGIRCTNGYVTHPFCSPSRAGMLAGRYQQRFGHEHNPFYDPKDVKEGFSLQETMFPQYLQKNGYVTGWIGKWHLGATAEQKPMQRGFSETFGFIGGGHKYRDWQVKDTVEYTVPIERDGQPVEVKDQLTIAFGHEGAEFVQRHPVEPWFLYTAFNAPHTPLEPTDERVQRLAGSIPDPKRRLYAAQVSLLDDAVGEILDALHKTAQDRRTLVFFFTDNGGPLEINGSSNAPLHGHKGQVYDGGIRVPFLASWPGILPAGTTYAQPVSSIDMMATSLAVAGIPMPTDKKYDSVNLLPYLKGENLGAPHSDLFWRSDKKLAVREGDWKLVRGEGDKDELYNLKSDIGEKKDLAQEQPQILQKLTAALEAWNSELVPPAFVGAGGNRDEAAKKRRAQAPVKLNGAEVK